MDNKEGEDGYDVTQNMTSTCIDTFGDHFKNICAEVVDVANELLTTITSTPDAIYELSLMYSSQEDQSRDNHNVEDLVSYESSMYITQEGLYTTRVEDLLSQDSSHAKTKVEDPISQDSSHSKTKIEDPVSQGSSQAKTKVEDPVSQDSSHAKTKVEDLVVFQGSSQAKTKVEDLVVFQGSSQAKTKVEDLVVFQGSSQAKTKVEDPYSQDSSQAKTKVEDLVSQDSSQAKTKVEDLIFQDSSQAKTKVEDLIFQDSSQAKTKVEESISQDLSQAKTKSEGLDSQESNQIKTKIEDPISQNSSHVNNKIEDLFSQESSHVNTKIGDLVSQDLSPDKTTTMMPNEWHTEENSKTSNIEDLNSYERSRHGHGDVSLKSRHNNEVNSSYSSQNESSICSSSPSQFQDDSFDSSGKTSSSSSLKSTDRDFLWVTRELDGNAYEVPNEIAIGSIHRKELNMVSELRSLKIENDKIDTNPLRTEEFKNIINLEDGWDDSLIHVGELEESIVSKNSNRKITYKKKMKSVLTSPKFLLSKKESSSAKGVEQTDPRHQQISLPIKEYSIDFDWEVL